MTQSGSSAPPPGAGFPFTPEEALQFMQRMFNPFGVPMPGFTMPAAEATPGAAPPPAMAFPNPAGMFATLDPAELERKIGELRIIENWLEMSLKLMQMSIKTMELQKASLEALRGTPSAQGSSPEGNAKSESSRKR